MVLSPAFKCSFDENDFSRNTRENSFTLERFSESLALIDFNTLKIINYITNYLIGASNKKMPYCLTHLSSDSV